MPENKKKTFRETLLSWGAKILLALLILSFGVWGIGDYVAPQQNTAAIASIGNSKITVAEFRNEVLFQVSRLQKVFGNNFTIQQAKAMGITQNVLNTLIQRKIFSEGAKEMGLIISDNLVSREIRNDDRFKSETGTFNRLRFDEIIQRAGLNETSYISLYKTQLLQNQFLSSINNGVYVSQSQIDSIYKYRNEKRAMNFIELKHSLLTDIPTASEEDLKLFHKKNAKQFTAPEYRSITLVRLQIEDIINEIEVSDAEIKDYYNDKFDEFKTPEKRKIEQILVSDKTKSEKIYQRILAGELYKKVAKDVANLSPLSLKLGTLTRGQIPVKKLADMAFNMAENTISKPVKTPLGWHILRVTKIIPAKQEMLNQVQAKLKKEIAEEKAVEALYNLSNKYEDELGSGSSIEEAAKRLNFKVQKILPFDAQGFDMSNKKIQGLNQTIVKVAFTTNLGQDSALTDFEDSGYFILHVNDIQAPNIRPFGKIRSKVLKAWRQNQQAIAAEKKIVSFLSRLKGGMKLTDVAKELRLNVQTSSVFLRTGEGLKTQIPGELITGLFKANGKEVVSGTSDNASFIAQIQTIKSADPDKNKEGRIAIKRQLMENIASDMSTQLANALRKKLGVTINHDVVDSVF